MDLPDAENRMKILRIFLSQENLEPGFRYDELANATEGYSGSDLKVRYTLILFHFCQLYGYIFYSVGMQNLCIAAAYRPVQELLDEEKKVINLLVLVI